MLAEIGRSSPAALRFNAELPAFVGFVGGAMDDVDWTEERMEIKAIPIEECSP